MLKTRYAEDERFHGTKSVLTVHNAIFKGIFSYSQLEIIPELHLSGMEFLQYGDGWVSTLRAGIAFADKINAVSPNYAAELVTPLGSHGLLMISFIVPKISMASLMDAITQSGTQATMSICLSITTMT